MYLYTSNGKGRDWVSEISSFDQIEQRKIGDITRRSAVTLNLACREVDGNNIESNKMGYKIEPVKKTRPEDYLEQNLSSS